MSIITHASLQPWRGALAGQVQTSRGALHHRRGWWLTLRVDSDEGYAIGHGDACPMPQFGGEDAQTCFEALQKWTSVVAVGSIALPDRSERQNWLDSFDLPPVARSALCQAVWSADAALQGESLSRHFSRNGMHRSELEHRIVSDSKEALDAIEMGFKALKIKVGSTSPELDLERIEAITSMCPDGIDVRLDANGAWSFETAIELWERLSELGVTLVEEPIASTESADWHALGNLSGPQIWLDESCRTLAQLNTHPGRSVAHGLVIKPMLNGGLDRALSLAKEAADRGMRLMVTSSLASRVEWTGACSVAAALTRHGLVAVGLDPQKAIVACNQSPTSRQVVHPVAASARVYPNREALHAGQSWSWQRLADESAAYGAALRQCGVLPGDVVAIEASPNNKAIAALHGITWAGATIALLDVQATYRESQEALLTLNPDWVIEGSETLTNACADSGRQMIAPVLGSTKLPAPASSLDATFAVVLSSGSSGRPQAHGLTISQLIHSLLGSAERLGHHASDRWLCPLPLHHVGGFSIVVRTAWLSTCAEILPGFDRQECATRLASGDVTLVSMTPGWLNALVTVWREQGQRPSEHLRAILVGGAAMPQALREQAAALELPVAETWGMSEAASQIATNSPIEPSAELGIAMLHTADVSSRGDQRLWVHGPLTARGLLATQDTGHVLGGHVQIHGRADRVFQVGGENVSSLEIERIAESFHAVTGAQAVPVSDKRYGRVVALLFEADPPVRVEALEAFMMQQLQAFKMPKVWIQVDELPRSSLGKKSLSRAITVSRQTLQALHREHEVLGQGTALATEAIDTGVHVANDGVLEASLAAGNRENQGHRTVADALERDGDLQARPQLHRKTVVRFCVDQRHHPIALGKDLLQRQANLDEHGLKSSMGDFKSAREERDSGGVDLGKSDSMAMNDHCTTPISSAQEPIERRVRATEGEPLR